LSARLACTILLLVSACRWEHAAFHCVDDASCVSGGVAGTCESNGFCSFPDSKCAGNRFGPYSEGVSGECVNATDDGGATGLTIAPASVSLLRGQTQVFIASLANATFSVTPADGGTVDGNGVYHTAAGSGARTVYVVAKSGTQTAMATIALSDGTLTAYRQLNQPLGLTDSIDGFAIVAAHSPTPSDPNSLWYFAFDGVIDDGSVATSAPTRDVVHTSSLFYFTTFTQYNDGAIGAIDQSGNLSSVLTTGLSKPEGIALGNNHTLYVANSQHHVVQSVSFTGTNVQTVAGTLDVQGTADGTGTAAQFNYPVRMAFDGTDTLYVSDTNNHTVRTISVSTGAVVTPWGKATVIGSDDGVGTSARFYGPHALTLDGKGHLYVADALNHTVRRIDLVTKAVSTIVGDPSRGTSAAGALTSAALGFPSGLTFGTDGNLYISDYNANTIYSVTLP
jgi:hypothetical protein